MKVLVKNKKVYADYEIVDKLDAGLVLTGYEVKSIKTQKAAIKDAIIKVEEREVWVISMDIPLYSKTSPTVVPGYNPKQRRKLLVTKKQRTRLRERTQKTGLHIVPLKLYLASNGKIKIEIGLAKRKKNIQKKQTIKEKDTKRMMDKEIRRIQR